MASFYQKRRVNWNRLFWLRLSPDPDFAAFDGLHLCNPKLGINKMASTWAGVVRTQTSPT